MNSHPLMTLVAEPAEAIRPKLEALPDYDPINQMTQNWVSANRREDVLCSGKGTGDPTTQSSTTGGREAGTPAMTDYDGDDSGT
jgi:hypothetical protein